VRQRINVPGGFDVRQQVTTEGRNLVSQASMAMLSELAGRTGLTHGL
jgi:hypothetical protein